MLTLIRNRAASRNETGAVAIIFALMTVMLLSVAALGTDIGNAVGRRSDTQTQADFGAFAAAGKMTTTGAVGQTPPAAVLNAVMNSLNANQPQDDKASCWRTKNCVTSTSQLTDASLTNGDVRYTAAGLQVTAPNHYVGFGMAQVMGFPGVNVGAKATVNVLSPGQRVLPLFAVQGCDYGLQTLADPSGGGATSVVPPLAFPTETNNTQLQSPLVLKNGGGTPVTTFAFQSLNNTLDITAQKWDRSTWVGFFRSDDTSPTAIVKVAVPGSPLGTGTGSAQTVTITVPAAVTNVETVWWVRIFDGTTANPTAAAPRTGGVGSNTWSPQPEALPVVVGAAALQCLSGPTAGNFGTIKFPRLDVPSSDFLPVDITSGLQLPLTPHTHDWALANPGLSDGTCTPGDATTGAIGSDVPNPGLMPNTNCVDTDTGLAANVATQGLIQGDTVAGVPHPGLLTTAGTRAGCDPNGGSTTRNINISGGPYKINDDVLTCYFRNGSTSINDIAKASYARVSPDGVLDPSIYSSPRFVIVPVLKVQPSGGSNHYSIIDFRPAFITDEQATSSAVLGSKTGTSDNGVTIQGQDIKQLKVVFFNSNALPLTGDFPTQPFLGIGAKVTHLVN